MSNNYLLSPKPSVLIYVFSESLTGVFIYIPNHVFETLKIPNTNSKFRNKILETETTLKKAKSRHFVSNN